MRLLKWIALALVLCIGAFPFSADAADGILYGIGFVDAGAWKIPLAFDGVHFTENGHRIFAENLYKYLIKENNNAGNPSESP